MKRTPLILFSAFAVNALFVFFAISPEFVSFAETAPRGVAPNDIVAAATAGRTQVLAILHSRNLELYVLAVTNIILVLWALNRGKP